MDCAGLRAGERAAPVGRRPRRRPAPSDGPSRRYGTAPWPRPRRPSLPAAGGAPVPPLQPITGLRSVSLVIDWISAPCSCLDVETGGGAAGTAGGLVRWRRRRRAAAAAVGPRRRFGAGRPTGRARRRGAKPRDAPPAPRLVSGEHPEHSGTIQWSTDETRRPKKKRKLWHSKNNLNQTKT